MKKVLFVIPDLRIGGVQKSIISFLNCLMDAPEKKEFEVQLLVVDTVGTFFSRIPKDVHLAEPPHELRWLGMRLQKRLFSQFFSWNGFLGEISWMLRNRLGLFSKALNRQQKLWECWRKRIPDGDEHYDIAISYMDGFSNYYVMEKVRADRKILWIHNEYQKQGCSPDFDRPFFESCQGIITISEKCRDCILKEFPEFAQKTYVLQNITDPKTIMVAAEEGQCPEYDDSVGLKLLSVGRLSYLKGFDLAIEAAWHLREAGMKFMWLVVGDGPERSALQSLIDQKELSDCFRLVGARDNPYGYMRRCDILVQPSRSEGKSIVIDEAKCLCKPIVATNYTTVSDTICHGKTGWVVEMDPKSLAEGILQLGGDPELREMLSETLKAEPSYVDQVLKQYILRMMK